MSAGDYCAGQVEGLPGDSVRVYIGYSRVHIVDYIEDLTAVSVLVTVLSAGSHTEIYVHGHGQCMPGVSVWLLLEDCWRSLLKVKSLLGVSLMVCLGVLLNLC